MQQSSDCPHNPRIAPNEVCKVWTKGNPRIARVTLSSCCRQVICRLRTYSTQETLLNVDIPGKAGRRNRDRKSIMLGKVARAELGKVQLRRLDRKSIMTCLKNTGSALVPCFQLSFPVRKVSLFHSRAPQDAPFSNEQTQAN